MKTTTTKKGILNAPISRIFLGLLVCLIAFIIAQQSGRILELTTLDKNYRNLIKGLIASAAVVSAYIWFYGKIEKRSITEFSIKGLYHNIYLGTTIGVLLQSLTILVIFLLGDFQIVSINKCFRKRKFKIQIEFF